MELHFFQAEHAAMLDLSGQMISAFEQGDPQEVARLRTRLNRLLISHLAKEDAHLYPMLKHDTHPEIAALACRYEEEMGDLAAHWSDKMTQWPDERIVDDLAGFEKIARAGLAELADRAEREEAELYPLYLASLDPWADYNSRAA